VEKCCRLLPAGNLEWRSVEDYSLLEILNEEVLKITPC
jgi:hypothetical protein